MYFIKHEQNPVRAHNGFFRPQWSRAGLWPHDGERCLCKSENKFSPWLAWAMALWGFIVPAKVIRESNCILYCPRMSGPNWARVPHPSTDDGVCLCVCMNLCSTCHMLAFMMHHVCSYLYMCMWVFMDSCLYICTHVVVSEIYLFFVHKLKCGNVHVCMGMFVSFFYIQGFTKTRVCVCACLWAGLDRAWEQVRQHH